MYQQPRQNPTDRQTTENAKKVRKRD